MAKLSASNTGINPVQGFKNKIINGNFDIWQRATSQTSSGYGSDDRWSNRYAGGLTYMTHTREAFTIGQTDVPGNPTYYSSTDQGGVVSTTDYCIKQYNIEDVATLSGKTATLSLWAKADSALNLSIEFAQNFGSGGSSTVTAIGVKKFALTTSWQKIEVTVSIPSISGKTVGAGSSLILVIWFSSGTSYDARNDTLGVQTGVFDIAQVQLEEGDKATEFEQRHIAQELALCMRYFQISGSGTYSQPILNCDVTSGQTYNLSIVLPVEMRDTPSTTITYGADDNFDETGLTMNADSGKCVRATCVANGTGKAFIRFTYELDAEL